MKLIFLDFDGVLNSHRFFMEQQNVKGVNLHHCGLDETLDPTKVELINQLVNQTGAQVVISSSWRICYPILELNQILENHGATFKAIDVTPYLSTDRGFEIADYLCSLKEQPTHYVIIDDDGDMGEVKSHLVKTSFMVGLTQEHFEECLKKLA